MCAKIFIFHKFKRISFAEMENVIIVASETEPKWEEEEIRNRKHIIERQRAEAEEKPGRE